MHEYTCPECAAVLRSNSEAPAGRKIRCKKCGTAFVPGGTLALADEPPPKPVDDDNDISAYGVYKDPNEDESRKNTIKFDDVADKFKRSTRGPAMAMMVLPTNLLIAQGALMFIFGVGLVLYGIFPVVFADVEPSEEEYRTSFANILFGLLIFIWSCIVCFGASKMQNLESYTWGWVGAVTGLPAGIFAAVMLRNPKVIAGFQEMIGALDDDDVEGNEDDEDEDDDDDDEDEDEDDDEPPRRKRR